MISGLNSGDYFVLVFLCAIMGTKGIVISTLNQMIKESKINSKIQLIVFYLIAIMIGSIICMFIMLGNSFAIMKFILNSSKDMIHYNLKGEVIKSGVILILVGLAYFKAIFPILEKLKIIAEGKNNVN